jgi:CRP-like cAMP-binding protein
MQAFPPIYKNSLLQNMCALDLALIEPHLVRCAMPQRMGIERSNVAIPFVYFIESGVASIVAKHANRDTEMGLIGSEGMTGATIVMGGDQMPHECYMQLAGQGMRLETGQLAAALSSSPTLRLFLLRFVQSLTVQTGFTALANARCNLLERLARWLLMCADRTTNGRLEITHEFLSVMLGMRRPGVTVGLQNLEGMLLIRATRGLIEIRDRAGLEQVAANSGYGLAEAEYQRLMSLPRGVDGAWHDLAGVQALHGA